MKITELQDAESYIFIKVVTQLAGRFKEGDYVSIKELSYNDDDKQVWANAEMYIDGFRSRIDNNRSFNVSYTPVYKIIKSDDGYMEAELINPFIGTDREENFRDNTVDVTGYQLRSDIEDFLQDLDYDEEDVENTINFFVNGYMKLDEDFADSLIFESTYVPYSNRKEEIQEALKKIANARELEQKELLRQRAVNGHITRKLNKLLAAKQAKADARKAAAILRANTPKKKAKTKKRK